jgi:hypothetical protein
MLFEAFDSPNSTKIYEKSAHFFYMAQVGSWKYRRRFLIFSLSPNLAKSSCGWIIATLAATKKKKN